MKKYILYLNEENNILEYMLPGDDNRQGQNRGQITGIAV